MVYSRSLVLSLLVLNMSATLMQATNVPLEEIQAALNAVPTQTQSTKEAVDAIKKPQQVNISLSGKPGISNEELRLIIREELKAQRLPRRLMRSPFKLVGVLGLVGAWGYWFVETHEEVCKKASIKALENILHVVTPVYIYLKMGSKKPATRAPKPQRVPHNNNENEKVIIEKKD